MTIPSNERNSREGRQAGICVAQHFPCRHKGSFDHEGFQVSISRLVLVYRKYAPGDMVLEGLEKEAREARKGL